MHGSCIKQEVQAQQGNTFVQNPSSSHQSYFPSPTPCLASLLVLSPTDRSLAYTPSHTFDLDLSPCNAHAQTTLMSSFSSVYYFRLCHYAALGFKPSQFTDFKSCFPHALLMHLGHRLTADDSPPTSYNVIHTCWYHSGGSSGGIIELCGMTPPPYGSITDLFSSDSVAMDWHFAACGARQQPASYGLTMQTRIV